MAEMVFKLCSYCGRMCWHNAMKRKEKEEQRHRCSFCGHPPTDAVGPKKALQEMIRQSQAMKPIRG